MSKQEGVSDIETEKSSVSDPFTHIDDLGATYATHQAEDANSKTSNKIAHGFWTLFTFTTISDLPLLAVAVVSICISTAALPLQTWIYGKIFLNLSNYYQQEYPDFKSFVHATKWLCGQLMIVALSQMLVKWLSVYTWLKFGENQAARVRKSMFTKIIVASSFEWFDLQENLIGSITQLNRAVEEFREGCSSNLGLLIETLVAIVGLFAMAMVQSWSLTLVTLGTTPFIGLIGFIFGGYIRKSSNMENDASSRCSKILDWNFVNNRIVKVYNAKYYEIAKFSKVIDESAKAFYSMSNFISLNTGVLKCLTLLMFVQGFWFGNYMISKGHLKINQVFTCFSSCLALGSKLDSVTTVFAYMNKAYLAIYLLKNFLNNNTTNPAQKIHVNRSSLISVTPLSNGVYPIGCKGEISLLNISFHYKNRPETPVLSNVSMTFKPKQLNFIIGQSGSGKSTLAQLILNLYKPVGVNGVVSRINIDGYNLETLSSKYISEHITYLQQTPAIFKRTLMENLTIGLDATEFESSRVTEACSFAHLEDIVATLEDGLQTIITPLKLSGGQKQRIALARAYIRNAEVLILDEALSAIDITNRQLIFQSIRKWRHEMTTLVITHDLSQITDNDYIFEMGNGVVMREGYFHEIGMTNHQDMQPNGIVTFKRHAKSPSIFKEKPSYIGNPAILQDLESSAQDSNLEMELKSTISILGYFKDMIDKKWTLGVGLFFSVLCAACSPVFSFCFAQLLSNMVNVSVFGSSFIHELTIWSCSVIAIAICTGVFLYLSDYLLSRVGEKWVANVRKETFAKLAEQDCSFYDLDLTKPSELTTLIMNDTRDLRTLVSSAISIAINLLIMVLTGIIWSIVAGWKLALVGIAFVPCILILTTLYSFQMSSTEHRYKTQVAQLENHIHDTIYNIKSIKTLDLSKSFADSFDSHLSSVLSVGGSRASRCGIGLTLSSLLIAVAGAVSIYYGMYLTGKFEYTQAQMLQVITLLTMTVANSADLMGQIPHITRGRRAGTFIIKLLELPGNSIELPGGSKPYTKVKKASQEVIDFEQVWFGYPTKHGSEKDVLQGFNFKVFTGQTVAIVGESGCGKSTIVALLERLYAVGNSDGSGTIKLKGTPINELDIEWLRGYMSYVPQSSSFFEGTILENLTYGLNPASYTKEDIENCLKRAQIYPFIVSLGEGLSTPMGEGFSSTMSGGQLQRLSIARALLRKPKLLLLDECTSSLDPENSRKINELVRNEFNDGELTTIVVTHSEEMMKVCERVCVVKHGIVIEEGNFEDLYEKRGELFKLLN